MEPVKIAICQMIVGKDKNQNLEKAEEMIRKSAKNGAKIVGLPEMFICPYNINFMPQYAETAEGETMRHLGELAGELGIYLFAGSIPEKDGTSLYNTCFIFGKNGEMLGRHRKAHLFDVEIQGGMSFKESDIFTAGDQNTIIDTEYGKIGIAICYDVRFPDFFRDMALAGAKLIMLPACFTMKTGEAHWDLTMRMRAVDNQVYFAAISTARNPEMSYQAYGHSCIVNPWGEFVARGEIDETILYGEVDFEYIEDIRAQLPLLKHRREELYK